MFSLSLRITPRRRGRHFNRCNGDFMYSTFGSRAFSDSIFAQLLYIKNIFLNLKINQKYVNPQVWEFSLPLKISLFLFCFVDQKKIKIMETSLSLSSEKSVGEHALLKWEWFTLTDQEVTHACNKFQEAIKTREYY